MPMTLEQYPPFLAALRTLRGLQTDYARAKNNVARRDELKPLIRDARAVADTAAELLRAGLESLTENSADLVPVKALFIQYKAVREAHRQAYSGKFQSAFDKLRDEEKKLDKLLKTASGS